MYMITDLLLTYRWWILGGGGCALLWLLGEIPSYHRVSQTGHFTAERDFARWRLHSAIIGLAFLLLLLASTLVLMFVHLL